MRCARLLLLAKFVLVMLLALIPATLVGFRAHPAVAAGPITIDVTTAGAKGDGVTDDTAAFQRALSQLAGSGGTLLVPSGTYLIQPATLTIPSNVAVQGTAATLKASVVGFALLDLQGTNISLSGLILDGDNKAVRGVTIVGGSTAISLTNDIVQNFTQPACPNPLCNETPTGIRIEGNGGGITIDATTVRNVVAINTNGAAWPHKVARGIWIAPASGQSASSKAITIKNSAFDNVGPKDDGDCIVIQDASNGAALTIDNNRFTRCHKRAIKIQVPGARVTNNQIDNPFLGNNLFDTYSQIPQDMYAAISVYASNVVVANNTIAGAGSFYAALDIGAGDCTPLTGIALQNNVVSMGASANLTGASLIRFFSPAYNPLITGNQLNYAQNGIVLHPNVTGATLSGNTIGANVTIPFQYYGTPCPVAPVPAPTPPKQAVAVPAYFTPGAFWTQLNAAAPTVGLAVINPNSGPGNGVNYDYVNQVQQSRARGLTVLGYVHTSYGTRLAADVKREIDQYYAWYGVDGIFFDEASTDCALQPYYLDLNTYVKAKGGVARTALNPGTQTNECYMAAADIVVTFEGSYTTYVNSYPANPSWVSSYTPNRFWHLVYAAPTEPAMRTAVTLSKQRGAGWIYVASDTLPNPWDTLPADPYWTDELAAASAALNNPMPVATGLSPTSAQAGGAAFTLTITGAGFVPGSTVQWNGAARPTTYVSDTRLTAAIPTTDLATVGVAEVTVVTPAPGGGVATPLPFFITATGASITSAASGTSTSPTGTAVATAGGTGPATPGSVSATANGSGTITVAQYAANPVTTAAPNGASAYFDVHIAPGSSFNALTVVDCNLTGTPGTAGYGMVYWWTGAAWQLVSTQRYDPATNCTTLTLNATSAPSLAQLAGTPFAVAIDRTPPVTTATVNPSPNASGWNASDVTVTLTATDDLSGVARTEYNLDGTGWTPYAGPLTVTAEGVHTVLYRSRDRAGNLERDHTLTVALDKTPPEAAVQFDPVTKNLVVIGRDALSGTSTGPISPTTVVPMTGDENGVGNTARSNANQEGRDQGTRAELRTYTVTDRAGNRLVLVIRVNQVGRELKAQIVSLQYNGGPRLTPPAHEIVFTWSVERDGQVKNLEQRLVLGADENRQVVTAKFERTKMQTVIRVESSETEITRPGLVLLRLATNQGKLAIER